MGVFFANMYDELNVSIKEIKYFNSEGDKT